MNKKSGILSIILIALMLLLTGCGGGGSGSSSAPGGNNTNVVSRVELLPVQYVAQTNSGITLHTKVLDGNGNHLPNITVTYTNLSLVGALNKTSAVTNSSGIATVNIQSTTPGFSTILAEVNTGIGHVRDKRTVYFTSADNLVLTPFLFLDVDGDGDGIFDETGDFIFFENSSSTDNQATVMATVYNAIGQLIAGSTVLFGTDAAYKVGSGTTCSDGTTSCSVLFPFGNSATTNLSGEASVLLQVNPNLLTSVTSTLNVLAQADNGAFNMLSLFINPITIGSVTVTADPTTIDSGATSTISAAVRTNLNTPPPAGTTVNFTATNGGIIPFAQTNALGLATSTFSAVDTLVPLTASITASTQGRSGSTTVKINANPPTLEVRPGVGDGLMSCAATDPNTGLPLAHITYAEEIITGGVPPYKISFVGPITITVGAVTVSPPNIATVTSDGGSFRVASTGCEDSLGNPIVPEGSVCPEGTNVTVLVRDDQTPPAEVELTWCYDWH